MFGQSQYNLDVVDMVDVVEMVDAIPGGCHGLALVIPDGGDLLRVLLLPPSLPGQSERGFDSLATNVVLPMLMAPNPE